MIETKQIYFRPGTKLPEQRIIFSYNCGGIGDYIHWTTAIQYAIESHPHLSGIIATPPFFAELAHLWLDNYSKRFKVITTTDFVRDPQIDLQSFNAFKCPRAEDNVDAYGHNLMQLGFHYYLNTDIIPTAWSRLPKINGDETDISKFNLPKNYAVITCGATSKSRTLSSKTINGVIEFYNSQGITPVFLGKIDLLNDYKAEFSNEINFHLGVDLREKTTLVEAACILARAQSVVGLDNGLLHLACCSDVPVVFGFTTVNPRHRLTNRNGKTIALVPTESLSCRFCQSNVRFLIGHDFRECIYNDFLCCESLTSEVFINAIKALM